MDEQGISRSEVMDIIGGLADRAAREKGCLENLSRLRDHVERFKAELAAGRRPA